MQKWSVIRIDPKGFIQLKCGTPITPREYIKYADKDLLLKSDHGNVNALSNAKRAIDCQITNLLSALGLSKAGNIHQKIERVKNIGILAPRILKKVNKIRNLLEHSFEKPSTEEAEDAVDIATLFVEATGKIFIEFMDSFWVARDGSENRPEIYKEDGKTIILDSKMPDLTFSDGVYIQYDEDSKDYGLWCYLNNEQVIEAEVKRGSPLHIELLRFSVLNHHTALEYEEDIVAQEFVSRVRSKDGVSL